jgi:hypothetical protein
MERIADYLGIGKRLLHWLLQESIFLQYLMGGLESMHTTVLMMKYTMHTWYVYFLAFMVERPKTIKNTGLSLYCDILVNVHTHYIIHHRYGSHLVINALLPHKIGK